MASCRRAVFLSIVAGTALMQFSKDDTKKFSFVSFVSFVVKILRLDYYPNHAL
jgi:hypothetical protein